MNRNISLNERRCRFCRKMYNFPKMVGLVQMENFMDLMEPSMNIARHILRFLFCHVVKIPLKKGHFLMKVGKII